MNKFVLALLLAVVNTGAWAQALWQGTEYGMDVAQVRKVIPAAIPPEKGGTLGNGAKELLRLPNVELIGKPFDAQFFFKDERLVQVTLTLREQLSFDSARTRGYEPLIEALRAKYGPELSNKIDRIGSLKTAESKWMSGRTNIGLYLLAVADSPATLNVIYQVRIAKEADKL